MKKPAKPANKKAVPQKSTSKKSASVAKASSSKKPVAKSTSKQVAKPAPKSVAKSTVKPVAKHASKPAAKVITKNKKDSKVAHHKVVAKIPPKKIEVKASSKAPIKSPAKAPVKTILKKGHGKSHDKIHDKIHEKIASSKKAEAEKVLKKEAAKKLAVKTEVHVPKKEVVKKLSKQEEKEFLKAEKNKAKENAKEKEKGKGKGKKSNQDEESGEDDFEKEFSEDSDSGKRQDEDEGDDFFEEETPKKVKMTFDEDVEEIIPVRKKNKSGLDDDIKENLAEEILSLAEDFSIEEVFASIRNMEHFKIESDECVVRGCDNPSTTNGYCRYHYIKLWKDVKKKELILTEGRLAKIIEDIVRKYPMKYIEAIIQDLADDKAFNHVLKDLDIETDESEIDAFDDDELLDDDQDIAFETKVVKPSFDD